MNSKSELQKLIELKACPSRYLGMGLAFSRETGLQKLSELKASKSTIMATWIMLEDQLSGIDSSVDYDGWVAVNRAWIEIDSSLRSIEDEIEELSLAILR